MQNILKSIKKQIYNINYDELVFDVVMAVMLSLVQFGFVAGGHEMLSFFPKWMIIVFAYFIQIVLSFNLGMTIYRYGDLDCNKLCTLLWWVSLFFVFFMLFFSGMGLVIELNLSEKTNLFLYLFSFVVIIISGGFGVMLPDDIDFEEKAHLNKKIIIAGLSAVAFAFLNYGVASKLSAGTVGASLGDFIVFILIMFVSGFLPYRLLMLFAPPKKLLNMIVAFVVITYDMLILYF